MSGKQRILDKDTEGRVETSIVDHDGRPHLLLHWTIDEPAEKYEVDIRLDPDDAVIVRDALDAWLPREDDAQLVEAQEERDDLDLKCSRIERELAAERARVERLQTYALCIREELLTRYPEYADVENRVVQRAYLQPGDLPDEGEAEQTPERGRELRAYRIRHRVSMRTVARYLGYTSSQVSDYELGELADTPMTDVDADRVQRWIGAGCLDESEVTDE